MRKKLFKIVPALVLAATMAAGAFSTLAACVTTEPNNPTEQTENLTDKPLEGEIFADYTKGAAEGMHPTNGYTNGSPFNNFWTTDCVTYDGGVMKLHIKDNPTGSAEAFTEYYGGEERSYQNFGYGDYEVRMKPAKKEGTASTFFLYTGSSDIDPETGEPNPWDEIDIEFLGKDTTHVQFNYFVNGVGGHEYMYDLGFDASEEFHNYGFRWAEDHITWFVDGEPVYRIDAAEDVPLPSHASKIIMNYWCGSEAGEGWMGKFEDPDDKSPEYEWIKINSEPVWGEIPEKVEVEEYEGDWTAIEAISTTYDKSDNKVGTDYVLTPADDGKSATVSWTKAGNYDNINFDISEAAADKNWLHFVIENTGDNPVNARVNIRNTDNSATINQYAFGNGNTLATAINEGTTVNLAKGDKVEVEIYYTDIAGKVEIMLGSLQENLIELAGSIKISDIKLDKQGEIIIPEKGNNLPLTINDTEVSFNGNGAYVINTDTEANTMDISYTAVQGASYVNVAANVEEIASTKNVFNATIKNNGEEAVTVRIDIIAKNALPGAINHKACNLSATQDGETAQTALDWGGSTFVIAAGEESEVTVTYDTAYGPEQVQLLIDSSTYDDTAIHAGNITLSKVSFTGEGAVDPDIGESDEPVVVPEDGSVNLTFFPESAGNKYTVDTTAATDSVTMSYTGIGGSDYAFLSTNDAAQYANGKDTFTVTLKNNGESAVSVRVDIAGTTEVDNGQGGKSKILNTAAVASDGRHVDTNLAWGGSTVVLEAGEEVTLVISYDESTPKGNATAVLVSCDSHRGDANKYSGNVTISGFKFTSSSAAE